MSFELLAPTATAAATETSAPPPVTDTPIATYTPMATPTATNTTVPTPEPVAFAKMDFTYDGNGARVKSVLNPSTGSGQAAVTTYFVGTHYEVEVTGADTKVTKYYYAGSQRIAMRSNGVLVYLLGDHLGSTSLTVDAGGNVVSELRYKAWGEVRYASGTTPTKYSYTGQYSYQSDFGLMYYNARWYDSCIMQFNQPDSVIPDPYNSLDWNRYAYARYNPLVYTDPTGHDPVLGFLGGFLKELARTNLWWHPGAQKDLAIHNNESTAELAGRLVADVVSMAVGVAEAGGGAGVAGGGVVACGTGVGCLVTPEALVAGGALIAQGSGTALNAANGAGTIIAMLSNNSNSSSNADLSRIYDDTYPKHHPNSPPGVGDMDLDAATAQDVLNQGVQKGREVYSYYNGKVYVFKYSNNGKYHGYIFENRVPTDVLKQWLKDKVVTKPQYNDMLDWSEK